MYSFNLTLVVESETRAGQEVLTRGAKGIGSSDNGLNLDGIPIRFKVQILLGANNSLKSRLPAYSIYVERASCTCPSYRVLCLQKKGKKKFL
jgi:hypothetical protein